MKSLCAAALPFLITACASTPPTPLHALDTIRDLPVNYHARLEPRMSAVRTPDEAAPAELPTAPSPAAVLEVHCQIARIDRDTLRALVPGSTSGVFARVVARDAFEGARETLTRRNTFALLGCPALSVRDGQTASIMVLDQRAYVRGFSITNVGQSLIADPEIDVAQAGYSMKATPKLSADGARVDIDITWAVSTMRAPFAETAASLPGTDTRVTLQIPIVFEQSLVTKGSLAPGEVLLLGGLVDEDGRDCIACVRAASAVPETALGAEHVVEAPLAAAQLAVP